MLLVFVISSLLACGLGYDAMATHFDGLGFPYGGCGVPEANVEYPWFLALNVQNTPLDYSTYLPRPIQDQSKLGSFNNGLNCGKYIRVTLGDYCTGNNGGVPGQEFCQGGQWIADEFSGAYLDYIVADSCQDGNRWCRDDRYHTDLKTESLKHFILNGREVDVTNKWNNRKVSWQWVKGPSSQLKFFWMANAQQYWPTMLVTGFDNGISKVKQNVGGQWKDAQMNSDMGQSWILPQSSQNFEIQVLDQDGKAYFGRSYILTFPPECLNAHCGGNPVYPISVSDEEVFLK